MFIFLLRASADPPLDPPLGMLSCSAVVESVAVLLQVIRFDEGATMPDKMFEIPDYCFEEKDK